MGREGDEESSMVDRRRSNMNKISSSNILVACLFYEHKSISPNCSDTRIMSLEHSMEIETKPTKERKKRMGIESELSFPSTTIIQPQKDLNESKYTEESSRNEKIDENHQSTKNEKENGRRRLK
ncbi:hypothetical protein V6N13_102555 [Hibiscus sabdariffa]|uniref:Uncharacterized protein n=1 Tax=Hibiscus sabdariffa TaxID=183260 RepID=A0ABR2D4F3_9ROSI